MPSDAIPTAATSSASTLGLSPPVRKRNIHFEGAALTSVARQGEGEADARVRFTAALPIPYRAHSGSMLQFSRNSR